MPIDDKNQEFELIMKTSDGDEILKNSDTVLVKFGPERNGIITSWLNGGYNEDLSAVFNHQLSQENIDKYGDGGILDFLNDLSTDFYNDLDLRSDKLSGLITSADMNSYSIACERYRDIEVIAITTAGARVNAVSAGDENVYFIDGEALTELCKDSGTVDNCHPTDFGFASMAKALTEVIHGIK